MTIRMVSRCLECNHMYWGEDFDYDIHMCVGCAEHWNPEGEDA